MTKALSKPRKKEEKENKMSQLFSNVMTLQNKRQDLLARFPEVCRSVVIQMEDAGLKRGASTLSELLFQIDSIDQEIVTTLTNDVTTPEERKEFLLELLESIAKRKGE